MMPLLKNPSSYPMDTQLHKKKKRSFSVFLPSRLHRFPLALALLLLPFFIACGLAEEKLASSQFQLASYPLPKTLQEDTKLIVQHLPERGTLLGAQSGLYFITGQGIQQIDSDPVVAMTPWQGKYILIARPKQLQLWDGAIHESQLERKLEGAEITAAAAQGKEILWLATRSHLWLARDTELQSFAQFANAREIYAFQDAPTAIVHTQEDSYIALTIAQDGSVKMEDFAAAGNLPQQIMPSAGGQIWGLTQGLLYRWTQQGQQNAWEAFGWTAKDANGQPTPIQTLLLDNLPGKLWALTEKDIFQITAQKVYRIERPPAITAIRSAQAAEDALWMMDNENLHRLSLVVGEEEVTYSTRIKRFMDQNCLRCHGSTGPGRNLDSYENTKNLAERIAETIEQGRMPPDRTSIVGGDANLIRQWIKNDFKE
jgi:mono/diheme cytochrome c family protein